MVKTTLYYYVGSWVTIRQGLCLSAATHQRVPRDVLSAGPVVPDRQIILRAPPEAVYTLALHVTSAKIRSNLRWQNVAQQLITTLCNSIMLFFRSFDTWHGTTQRTFRFQVQDIHIWWPWYLRTLWHGSHSWYPCYNKCVIYIEHIDAQACLVGNAMVNCHPADVYVAARGGLSNSSSWSSLLRCVLLSRSIWTCRIPFSTKLVISCWCLIFPA